MEGLLTNCPEAAWKTLSTYHRFEKLIYNVESHLTAREIELGMSILIFFYLFSQKILFFFKFFVCPKKCI